MKTTIANLPKFAETFSQMENLFRFSHDNPELSASDALRQLVSSFQANPHPNSAMSFNPAFQNPNMQGTPGVRTPNFTGNAQFASPAPGAHLNLPMNTGSPATINMSPAMHAHGLQQAAGVAMINQQSQQGTTASGGTGSQGTSANTSPNVTNKRRRPSGVKAEVDDGGVTEVNGTNAKVKASPRVGGKRQKGAA